MRSRQDGRRRAVRRAAGTEQPGFAEQIDVGERGLRDGPGRTGCDLFRRAPEPDHPAQRRQPRRHLDLGQPHRQRCRRHQRIAAIVVDLLLEHFAVERVMQRQRSARQQPDHQR